jgi:hypothetical protein
MVWNCCPASGVAECHVQAQSVRIVGSAFELSLDLERRWFASFVRPVGQATNPRFSSLVPHKRAAARRVWAGPLCVVVLGIVTCKPSRALPRWSSPDIGP